MEYVHYPHLSREREDEGERNTCTTLPLPRAGERTALATCPFATSLAEPSRIGRGDTAAAASR